MKERRMYQSEGWYQRGEAVFPFTILVRVSLNSGVTSAQGLSPKGSS